MANNGNSSSMQSDQYFAEMLNMMREQGRKDNPTTLQLGIMQSANSVKIDDLVLNAEDLYIADYLVSDYTRKIKVPYINNVTASGKGAGTGSGTVSGNACTVNVTTDVTVDVELEKTSKVIFTDGLKKGDLVAVMKLQATNRYVILAKVVEA